MTNALSPAHAYTPFFCHSGWQTPPTHTHSHPCSNFPRVSAASSLQCDCAASLVTLRIIEYRSPASAAVCKRVFLRTSVHLTGALQGHCHGNVKTGAFHRAATEHRSQGSHQEGDERGVGEHCSTGVLEERRSHSDGHPLIWLYTNWSQRRWTGTVQKKNMPSRLQRSLHPTGIYSNIRITRQCFF